MKTQKKEKKNVQQQQKHTHTKEDTVIMKKISIRIMSLMFDFHMFSVSWYGWVLPRG